MFDGKRLHLLCMLSVSTPCAFDGLFHLCFKGKYFETADIHTCTLWLNANSSAKLRNSSCEKDACVDGNGWLNHTEASARMSSVYGFSLFFFFFFCVQWVTDNDTITSISRTQQQLLASQSEPDRQTVTMYRLEAKVLKRIHLNVNAILCFVGTFSSFLLFCIFLLFSIPICTRKMQGTNKRLGFVNENALKLPTLQCVLCSVKREKKERKNTHWLLRTVVLSVRNPK